MAVVTVGCRLPSGLEIQVGDKKIELAGQNQRYKELGIEIILLKDEDYGTTEVEASFWEAWKQSVGSEYAPLKSGAIFEAKNATEAKAQAKDLKDKKTGHEPMAQTDGKVEKAS